MGAMPWRAHGEKIEMAIQQPDQGLQAEMKNGMNLQPVIRIQLLEGRHDLGGIFQLVPRLGSIHGENRG